MAPRKKTNELHLEPGQKAVILAGAVFLILLAAAEVFGLGWGSGAWLGRLSFKWTLTLALFYFFFAGVLAGVAGGLYHPQPWARVRKRILASRNRLGSWRWLLIAFMLVFPAWFVFFSPWGGLFVGLSFRALLFLLELWLVGVLLTDDKSHLIEWRTLLLAGLLMGAVLVLAESLALVSDYPFALHWSEGNRLWDYSIAFGRGRYNYAGAEPIFAWIDSGRQTLWGLPFIFSDVPIWLVRLWSAILVTVPYALLGWIAFRPLDGKRDQWLVAGLWALVFLNQGPIYTPLVLAAMLVAIAHRKPLWLALPLVYFAGDYAGASRFTWSFAPAIWAVLLSFGDSVLARGILGWQDWLRAGALSLAGIWTKGLPILAGVLVGVFPFLVAGDGAPISPVAPDSSVETLQGLQAVSTHQPFLWERLFPNAIYPPGILLGLVLATLPLIWLMVYLIRNGFWKTTFWQRIAMLFGIGVMLVVGVIASAKVGGGTDLHNMDMFLVGLVLVAAIGWEGGLATRFHKLLGGSATVRWLLAGMVFIPAFLPIVEGRPLDLPSQDRTQFVLQRIQDKVECARQYGEVLFMDQRQLLTFGLMGDLPLVVEYEKKFVMNQALSEDEDYFEKFREDLASGRFSLIVSEREAVRYKEADLASLGDSLIEENNAWVTWVTIPLLHSYESVGEFKDVAVELFMPIERDFDCP